MVGLIGGRYELVEFVGKGGMGAVWKAEDRLMGRDVAVKLLKVGLDDDEGKQRRFLREWQVTAGLEHVNVVRAYDCGWGEFDGSRVMYLVMELLDGMSLHERIALEKGRGLPVPEVIRWAGQICGGLEAAHKRKLVHRDLKPANVQITAERRGVLLDFGIACFQEDAEGHTRITPTGYLVGTPAYMSPEQFEGSPGTIGSDLYSLGCLLYVMLTGRPPFEGDNARDLWNQHLNQTPPAPGSLRNDDTCPQELDDLVLDLLKKDPRDRPADVAEVLSRLKGIQEERTHSSRGLREEAPSAPSSDSRRSRTAPTPARVAVGVTWREEWLELAGACMVAGAGTFGLLYGAGGVDADTSLLWGVVSIGVPFFGGLAANHGVGPDLSDDGTAGCLFLTVLIPILVGCVWLTAARGDFAWYYDLFIGLGLALTALAAALFTYVVGAATGRSGGAGVMALLNGMLLGALVAVLLAAHHHFVWWTTALGTLCVWGAGLTLTRAVYRFARS
ncbi:serine/threonine protein kinase [Streptomyces europaeiscabiei]|uniref:non-specific serine/threonine protein kinase n=1 Tax=Streptomyces europaeiscabiei TaxID=146819 RepID=A0ABU4NK05_9ACTN|nr:serine/threonine-protein kinase [Streptomyces europaeiscabiei]MDX2762996.1 serine/threonine-protein kinase [Streptomyces europaeiscabiei]MDX2772753.1 serine/threonine-protein kinase [Streptomyces europaeiscabiei]MDX3544552.1 serine/threonine-protein kinase [Streptomyces europaeiscabiei]MDX3553901.1 serine/threonine-protein kinase [Streptomyces europaeiscabiei]MDX3702019.1 serine/threonine-protein kinase [Streptomyces europaeiscabiei]